MPGESTSKARRSPGGTGWWCCGSCCGAAFYPERMKLPRLRSRADGLALLALLALDLSAYGLLLDPGRMLVDYDALVYFYPLRAYAAMAIQEGRLPLWNPHSFLGVPFV